MRGNEHSNSPARRLESFSKRPETLRVTERYADWMQSDNGVITCTKLAGYAMTRVAGRISRPDYKQSVRKLAVTSGLPTDDFLLIAKCILEQLRCMLAGSGQIPFTPTRWDEEDGDA